MTEEDWLQDVGTLEDWSERMRGRLRQMASSIFFPFQEEYKTGTAFQRNGAEPVFEQYVTS